MIVKKGQRQEVECLKLDTIPIVLTQFRPTNSNKRTKEENEQALEIWKKFMIFVDDLLTSLEVYKFIITDKDNQKTQTQRLLDCDGLPVRMNRMVNNIMADLLGVSDTIKEIKKDELRKYQNQITIDLLEVREFVLDKFINAFEFTGSHKEAKNMALKLAKKKYNI